MANARPCSGSVRRRDQTSPDKRHGASLQQLVTVRGGRSPPAVVSGSQVLVGVVLALAVGGGVQEGQLVAAALQLQDLTAQVQAAL